jgi:hypothetical protein
MRGSAVLFVFAAALAAPWSVHADVLLIERTEQAQRAALPSQGQTMAQVEASHGVPIEKLPPVAGNKPAHPPITRWRYRDYTVYFEHQRVISTVLNPTTAIAAGR